MTTDESKDILTDAGVQDRISENTPLALKEIAESHEALRLDRDSALQRAEAAKKERDEAHRDHIATIEERDEVQAAFDELATILEVEIEYSNLRGYRDIIDDCQIALDNGVGKDWLVNLTAAREELRQAREQASTIRKWANLGGAPLGVNCEYDPKDVHEIHGASYGFHGQTICLTHCIRALTKQAESLAADNAALRAALKEAKRVMDHFGDFLNGMDCVDAVEQDTGVPNSWVYSVFEGVTEALSTPSPGADLLRRARVLEWLEKQSELDVWMRGAQVDIPAAIRLEPDMRMVTVADDLRRSYTGATVLEAMEAAMQSEEGK